MADLDRRCPGGGIVIQSQQPPGGKPLDNCFHVTTFLDAREFSPGHAPADSSPGGVRKNHPEEHLVSGGASVVVERCE